MLQILNLARPMYLTVAQDVLFLDSQGHPGIFLSSPNALLERARAMDAMQALKGFNNRCKLG